MREQLNCHKLGDLLHFIVLLEGALFQGGFFSLGEVDEFLEFLELN